MSSPSGLRFLCLRLRWRGGIFPDDHPLGFGYADPSLNRAAARALTSADVALVVGKRIDFRLALGAPRVLPEQLKIIQVDIHAAELGINRRIDVPICADAKSTLGAMLTASRRSDTSEWLAQLQSFRDEWQSWLNVAADDTSSPMHPAAFYRELKQALPAEILYSWDGGDFAHWGRAMLQATKPGSWMRLGPLATIGAALPNGLALQMANPDKPVVVITGDGSLGFISPNWIPRYATIFRSWSSSAMMRVGDSSANYRVGTIPSAASCGQLDMTSSCRGLAARERVLTLSPRWYRS